MDLNFRRSQLLRLVEIGEKSDSGIFQGELEFDWELTPAEKKEARQKPDFLEECRDLLHRGGIMDLGDSVSLPAAYERTLMMAGVVAIRAGFAQAQVKSLFDRILKYY